MLAKQLDPLSRHGISYIIFILLCFLCKLRVVGKYRTQVLLGGYVCVSIIKYLYSDDREYVCQCMCFTSHIASYQILSICVCWGTD